MRYVNELNRLCGVLERRLAERDYIAGDYSIADIASWPWLRGAHKLGQSWDDFPKLKQWIDRIYVRPAVTRALALGEQIRGKADQSADTAESARILFGQTARSVADACAERKG